MTGRLSRKCRNYRVASRTVPAGRKHSRTRRSSSLSGWRRLVNSVVLCRSPRGACFSPEAGIVGRPLLGVGRETADWAGARVSHQRARVSISEPFSFIAEGPPIAGLTCVKCQGQNGTAWPERRPASLNYHPSKGPPAIPSEFGAAHKVV